MMPLFQILQARYPAGGWSLYDNSDGKGVQLAWDADITGTPKPSESEIAQWLKDMALPQARAAKLAEINAGYASVIGYIQAGYPPDEVLSWPVQADQARALATSPEAEALFVRSLAATKGLSVDEMRDRILANAASWEPVAAMLTGQRQLMEEAALAATTVEAVQAIRVAYTV